MGGVTLPDRHEEEHESRRLTVPELERYIRLGCSCSVCEYVRAEIRARQMEAPKEKERAARAPGRNTNGAWKASRCAE